jgi:hypothetical protein
MFAHQWQKVGEIDHLLIDKITGRVTYAVMSFGGFLGVAHRHYTLLWPTLKYNAPVLRDRWEYSHIVRAGFGLISLALLAAAVTL